MIRSLDRRLRRVADGYAPDLRYLAVVRVVFGIWVIVFPVDVRWVADLPAAFVNPRPGLFAWLSAPPDEPVVIALMVVKAICGGLVALGLWTRPASIVLSLSMVTTSGIVYSFSKVDHFILFELAPLFLAFAGWGDTWSVDAALRRRRRGAEPHDRGGAGPNGRGLPVLLFAMTVGWAMFTAMVPKVTGGWLDPARHATRGYIARDLAQGEKVGPLGRWLLEIDSSTFWKLLDYATLIVEGGLIVFVFAPVLFRRWLVLVIAFHVGVYLALGINFADNLLAYSVFFSPVFVWLLARRRAARPPGRVAPAEQARTEARAV